MMRKLLLFGITFWLVQSLFAQANSGANCGTAKPFCSGTNYIFPNSTGTQAPSGPNYGCLSSRPNPIWYYLEIDNPGTIQLRVEQRTQPNGGGSGIDVDFAMWGPFTTVAEGCGRITSRMAPIQCSYSASAVETIGIGLPGGANTGASTPPSAVRGSIYIVLLTNYSGSNGFISLTQSAGTGTTSCDIVALPIDIVAMSSSYENRLAKVSWELFDYIKIDYQEVQRSYNGLDWDKVETINMNGEDQQLRFNYEELVDGRFIVYYRIALVNFEGKKKYSDIVLVKPPETEKEIFRSINEMGIVVDRNYKGLVINQYTDGTTDKSYNY